MEQIEKKHEFKQQMNNFKYAQGSASFQFKIENISNNDFNSKLNIKNSNLSNNIKISYKDLDVNMVPSDKFSQILFSKINTLRANPQSYIKNIEEAKKNILLDKKKRLIYNGKIKIALSRGKQAFNEAINFLKSMKPMNKLIYNPYLVVEMPKNECEINYKNDLILKVENKINEGIMIKSFWKSMIKDPEISFLMMIVDDIGQNSGMKRRDLFDINMKYIGISSVAINGKFVSYITLATEE
jgi:hypothetical protein